LSERDKLGCPTKSLLVSSTIGGVRLKVKVTKNIIRKNGVIIAGLTIRDLISASIGLIISGLFIYFLKGKVSMNTLMNLSFLIIAVVVSCSVVKIQGMSLMKLLILTFKGVDKRPYNKSGGFSFEFIPKEKEKN